MKLALFGRTRGRGTKVEEWPDVQFMLRHKERIPGRRGRRQIAPARCGELARNHAGRKPAHGLRDHRLSAGQRPRSHRRLRARHGRRLRPPRKRHRLRRRLRQRSLDYFHQIVAQCVQQKVSRLVICDTTGGASPEEVANVFSSLTETYPARQIRISRPHRPRPRRRQLPRRDPCRSGAGPGHAARHRRALRQRQPHHRHRQHAAPRRSRVCPPRIAHRPHQPRALRLRGLPARSSARRAHRRPRSLRHLGRHARQQRAQKPRRLSLVRSRTRRRQPRHRRQRPIRPSQYHPALASRSASRSTPRRPRLSSTPTRP